MSKTSLTYRTLCTPFDVLRFTNINNNVDVNRFANEIFQQEESLANGCLGRDFYKAMVADKIAYTYNDFQNGISYNANDVVLYFGILYKCIIATTGSQYPSIDSTNWIEAPRFSNADYQELFNLYLAQTIALYVAAASVISSSIDYTAQGATRKEGDTFRPADYKELGSAKQQFLDSARLVQRNMDVYLKENKTAFPLYLPNKTDVCGCNDGCGTKRKFYGFNL